MKTRDEQELADILKHSKTDIAKMLIHAQRTEYETIVKLRNEVAVLKAELAGRDKVFKLLELMAGEAQLGLRTTR